MMMMMMMMMMIKAYVICHMSHISLMSSKVTSKCCP